ncbi:BspA family leucine-rich repeat surface protein [Enterococcus sp. CR-Ec1]|uniref:BspA family leucine-rich repeat surface protein n=1 Tax=Enterococcus sp. CR-Ec1 TaxID=2057791 RepID=UPI000C771A11|nr:BspA family leucine-rich repeat surface protein [Enterococcus sp. CR-Ec1]AUJ87417.1 hypothetical protein CXM95_18440 [Enterococcus sp. CR-Ec1]
MKNNKFFKIILSSMLLFSNSSQVIAQVIQQERSGFEQNYQETNDSVQKTEISLPYAESTSLEEDSYENTNEDNQDELEVSSQDREDQIEKDDPTQEDIQQQNDKYLTIPKESSVSTDSLIEDENLIEYDSSFASGTWGSATWTLTQSATGKPGLYIYGEVGSWDSAPWQTGEIFSSSVTWISGQMVLPSVSTRLFMSLSNLESIEGSIDTSNVTRMDHMFSGARSLRTLDVSKWDTSNVTNMADLFYAASSLVTVDVGGWDTSNVTNMDSMFANASSLTTLDVSGWDTSNVTNMQWMFAATRLVTLDVSKWDTSNVTNLTSMFSNASSLTTVDVSSWNTSNVTNISRMFINASSLSSLDLSKWDTSNLLTVSRAFANASSLTTLNLSNWKTSKFSDIDSMFADTNSLVSLDVGNWDTSNVANMSGVFSNASSLTTLDLSNWDTSKTTSMSQMFSGTVSLSAITLGPNFRFGISPGLGLPVREDGSTGEGWQLKDRSSEVYSPTDFMSRYGTGDLVPGTYIANLKTWGTSPYEFDDRTGKLTVYSGVLSVVSGSPWTLGDVSADSVTEIEFVGEISAPSNSTNLFRNLTQLKNIVGKLDTSSVTNMSNMFANVSSLTTLDLSNWDTSKTIIMSQMFSGTVSLSAITLGPNFRFGLTSGLGLPVREDGSIGEGWQLKDRSSEVYSPTDFMSRYGTGDLVPGTYVANLKNTWGTSPYEFDDRIGKLTVYSGVLSVVSGSPWELGNVTADSVTEIEFVGEVSAPGDSTNLFRNLTRLKSIVGKLDTSSVTNMSYMFSDASSLTTVDVSSWNTSSVTNMSYMFSDASSLTTVDVSSWNTSSVTSMLGMFSNASSLTSLDAGNWNTDKANSMRAMFSNASSLITLDLSNWNTNFSGNRGQMFAGTSSLRSITLGPNFRFGTNFGLGLPVRSDGSIGEGWQLNDRSSGIYSPANFMARYGTGDLVPGTYVANLKTWGTSPYEFDDRTGKLTVYSGVLSVVSGSPWELGDVTADSVTEIEFVGEVSAPSDSTNLFRNLTRLKSIVGKLDTSSVTNMSYMFSNASSLTTVDVSSWDTSKVTQMAGLFESCESLISVDLSDWSWSGVLNMDRMFYGCKNLKNVKLGYFIAAINSTNDSFFENAIKLEYIEIDRYLSLLLPENDFGWIDLKNGQSANGTVISNGQPSIFVWNRMNNLSVESKKNNNVTIGEKAHIHWELNVEDVFETGEPIENLNIQISTKESIDFSKTIDLIKTNSKSEVISSENIELNEVNSNTYMFEIPKLEHDYNYIVTFSGEAWNNSLSDAENNLSINVDYDAHILIDSDTRETAKISRQSSSSGTLIIDNGSLFFGNTLEVLSFSTAKLSHKLNGKLIPKEDNKWGVIIKDFRGTNPLSSIDYSVSRQMWELVATTDGFKDSGNRELPDGTMGIVFVDESNVQHDIGTSETILIKNDVDNESPKDDNTRQVTWDKGKGLHVIVNNRNNLREEETYTANITFDLRSAP